MVDKWSKVYVLTPEEGNAFLKDAYGIWSEVRKESGEMGAKLMDAVEKFRFQIN
jgi:hypothetical protein